VSRVTRSVCEKIAHRGACDRFMAKLIHNFFRGKSVSQKFVLLQQFSKQLPKENNGPTGKNSPNLVTLSVSHQSI
jgi:hypothetical protein